MKQPHLRQISFKRFMWVATKSKSTKLLMTEILIGSVLLTILLSIFFQLAQLVYNKEVILFDEQIITLLYAFRSPFLTQLMKIATTLGGKIFIGSTILGIIFYLIKKHTFYAYIFAFVLFTGIGLNLLLKNLFERPRPFLDPLVFEATFSFPSGHSMNSFIFYTTIVFFLYRTTKNKKVLLWMSILCSLVIFMIGVSRIYLGAHYPSDVLAGWIAGFCWFSSVVLFEKVLTVIHLFGRLGNKR